MKFPAVSIALAACCLLLSNCGGGGEGGDVVTTIRPQTMDGIVMALDNSVQIEFIRNTNTPAAINNGDVENGTFIYTSNLGQVNLRYYDNLQGDKSNLFWPQVVNVANYTYRAVNDSSGVLTLTGTGQIQSTYYNYKGIILNDSAIIPFVQNSGYYYDYYYYYYDYYYRQYTDYKTNLIQIDVTFSSNGSYVNSDTITLSQPTSPLVSTVDTVRIPSALALADGSGGVPASYNPTIDPLRESRITPASLSNLFMNATNGIPDSTKNFTIQFVADANQPVGGANGTMPDEVGHGLLRVAGSAVDVALDYTWRRIGGTDTGEMVLSNIPDDPTLPFDISLNGTYTLSFYGAENGAYAGIADADTLDPAEVSGTFRMLSGESGR